MAKLTKATMLLLNEALADIFVDLVESDKLTPEQALGVIMVEAQAVKEEYEERQKEFNELWEEAEANENNA